jgi:hypothetical protein
VTPAGLSLSLSDFLICWATKLFTAEGGVCLLSVTMDVLSQYLPSKEVATKALVAVGVLYGCNLWVSDGWFEFIFKFADE